MRSLILKWWLHLTYLMSLIGGEKFDFRGKLLTVAKPLVDRIKDQWNYSIQGIPEEMRAVPKNLTVVSFVNGIYHSEEDWERIVNQLSSTFDCKVHPFYNPSTGNWAADVSSASMQLLAKPNDFDLAKNLSRHLKQLIQEVGDFGRVLHIAHSGGAILTYLAAKHHLTIAERDKVDVVTFGGGHSLTRKYFWGRLINYYARNDPCLFVDQRALRLSRSKYAKFQSQNSGKIFCEVFDTKHNTSFVFMTGLTGNPIRDHSIEGPTYKIALDVEAKELINRRNAIWNRLQETQRRDKDRIRMIRKYFSRKTGRRHTFSKMRRNLIVQTKSPRRIARNLIRNIKEFMTELFTPI